MKQLREESKRRERERLEKYGADHKSCGGSLKKFASGGKVKGDDDEHEEKESAPEEKAEHKKHRADGGPIAGGGGPRLGRGRKGKGQTNVTVAVMPKGGDSGPALPPALGAGPAAGPTINPTPAPLPRPLPVTPAGGPPMKRGGSVKKKH